MHCPRCEYPCRTNEIRCPLCGSNLNQATLYLPAPKKRNHWIPVVILAAMFVLGTTLFFLIPMDSTQALSGSPDSYFTVVDGALYFDESQYSSGPILSVPDTVNGQTVTSIAEGCFQNVSGITTIYLPDSLRSIEDHAFAQCTDLRGLLIPDGVTSIGTEAFSGCGKLEAMYIPASVNSIGEDAFEDCPGMRYLFYPGFYAELYNMYPQVITPFTAAICLDGNYRYAAV